MTPEQISLVQTSFAQVEPMKDKAAGLFYAHLWEIDPSTAPLFASADMGRQGHKLMAALGLVVKGLTNPQSVMPTAQAMALRHVDYGVTREQYASMGATLLWTLGQMLGAAFTPEVEKAWVAAYALVSGAMVEAAYDA